MLNFSDIAKVLPQLQTIKTQSEQKFKELEKKRVIGESGAGMLKVVFNGTGKMLSIDIEDSLIEKQDKQFLQDLIVAAINDAQKKIKTITEETMLNNMDALRDLMQK